MSIKKIIYSLLLIFLPGLLHAQDADEPAEYEYTREITYGVNFNTNGGLIGGFDLRFSYLVLPRTFDLPGKWAIEVKEPRLFKFFAFEIANVKHPKELRYYSQSTGDSFLLGKLNYLFPIRPTVGLEYILFHKAPQNGVQVNFLTGIGPSIGIVKPYYLLYDFGSEGIKSLPYDPVISNNRILGHGTPFDGLGSSEVELGWHFKMGLNFEFGQSSGDMAGLEVGTLLEYYPDKIPLLDNAFNRSSFSSLYVILYYGKRN